MGLGVVHAGQAEPGIEAAGFGGLGKDFRLLFQVVLLPGAGDRLDHGVHISGGGRLGQQHPQVEPPFAAGIEQQRVVAQGTEGLPPFHGPEQIAAGALVGVDSSKVVVVDVNGQPATGALLAFGMEANQLGAVLTAAGEMARQFIQGHPVLAAQLRGRQGHGLVAAPCLQGLMGG